MKQNQVLAILMASILLLLVGCQRRVNLTSPQKEPQENTKENTQDKPDQGQMLVNFSADIQSINLRAYPTDPAEQQKQRTNFNGLRLVFYNVDEHNQPTTVAQAFNLDVHAKRGAYSGFDCNATPTGFSISKPLRIPRNNYQLYAIASPSEEISQATAQGQPFSQLKEPFSYGHQVSTYRPALDGFVYINSDPIEIQMDANPSSSQPQIVDITDCKLQPVHAYASVEWQPVIQDTNFQLPFKYILCNADVMNRKFNLLPEYDQTLDVAGLKYPIDSNYDGMRDKSLSELATDFVYTFPSQEVAFMIETGTNASSLDPARQDLYIFLPENTMHKDDLFGSTTTRLIIAVPIYPKDFPIDDQLLNDKVHFNNSPSWVMHNGKSYTEQAFDAAYQKAKQNSPKSPADEQLISAYAELKPDGEYPKWGYHGEKVRYYRHGYSFFQVPIRHFTSAQLQAVGLTNPGIQTGEYGVVRNTHYHIVINSFKSIGVANPHALLHHEHLTARQPLSFPNITITDPNLITHEIDTLY